MNTQKSLSSKAVSRRYQRQAAIATVLFMILIATIIGPAHEAASGFRRTVLTLLPMLPLAWAFWAISQYLGRADELVRRVNLEALAIATGVITFLSLAYGLLEDLAGFPRLALWWVFVAIYPIWAFAAPILWRRYK